jgi:hypothetical protein
MKPSRANRASKGQLSVATGFALLRESCFEIDTIPKPGGLGSGGLSNGVAVQLSSSICPSAGPVLSSFCPAPVRALEYPWKTNFRMF